MLERGDKPVESVSFSRDGRLVAAADGDGVAIYRLGTKRPVLVKNSHVGGAAISPGGRYVVVGNDYDQLVRYKLPATAYWDDATYLHRQTSVQGVAFSPGGRLIAYAALDGTFGVWAWRGGSLPSSMNADSGALNGIAFSPDGQFLVTAGDDGTARVWRWRTPQAPPVAVLHNSGAVNSAAFSPDGRFVVTAGTDGTVRVWNLRAPNDGPAVLGDESTAIESAVFSPDGRQVLTAGEDGTTRLHAASRAARSTSSSPGPASTRRRADARSRRTSQRAAACVCSAREGGMDRQWSAGWS